MTSRGDIRNLCRRRLGDLSSPAEYSDLQINQWINDAIADYSIYFPRELAGTIDLESGVHAYSLTELVEGERQFPGIRHILRVEYPLGEDPPEYLEMSDEKRPSTFYGKDYYDTLGDPPETLVIGAQVSTGESVGIRYQADHDFPADDEDVITVPDRHLELIVLFVRMAAAQENAQKEMFNPRVTTLLSSTLSTHANRCEREYRSKVEALLKAESSGGMFGRWHFDGQGRIY